MWQTVVLFALLALIVRALSVFPLIVTLDTTVLRETLAVQCAQQVY